MKALKTLAAAVVTIALTACTQHSAADRPDLTIPPPTTGPSGPALSVNVQANPDSISQDGRSASTITVTVLGPTAPKANQRVRLDMRVNGVAQDFGTLSPRETTTDSRGVATATFTAPPASTFFGTCFGLPGTCIDIVATPIGDTSFEAATPQSTSIRLVPPGVILPPAGTPTAAFSFSPSSVAAKIAVIFDASASTPGSGSSAITNYAWTFGDGGSASGATATATHTFGDPGTFNVTLTVTNDRGRTASTTQSVTVSGGNGPTASVTFSPTQPRINEAVFFNGAGSTAGAGHTITSYRWDFGDGSTGTGVSTSHTYAVPGTYTVVLTVTDEAGQTGTSSGTSVPVGSGNPNAVLLVTKTGGLAVQADGSGSSAAGTATIATYTFLWGDGTAATTTTSPAATHTFGVAGTYTITLRVTDNLGRVGQTTQSVTVP